MDRRGSIDILAEHADNLDIIIAGFHEMVIPPRDEAENTGKMIRAIQDGMADIIAHPANRRYPVNMDAVVRAAAEAGVVLEINEASFMGMRPGAYANCKRIVKLCRKFGVTLCISSDAHYCRRVGVFDKSLNLAREMGLNSSEILNSSTGRVVRFIKERKKAKGSLQAV